MANIFHATQDFEGVPANVNRAMIVANNGSFQFRRVGDGLIEATTRLGEGWPSDGLCDWQEGLQLGFAEKIPLEKFQQVVGFFRAVHDRFGSEALVLLFYAPAAPEGQKWFVVVPEQKVNPSKLWSPDPGPAPQGWLLAGTIHSHGGMGAFHSPTDDNDEQFKDGIHITVGSINGAPDYSCSVVVTGRRFKLELQDLVEGITPTEFPAEWLSRVSRLEPPKPKDVPGKKVVYSTGNGGGVADGQEILRRLREWQENE